MATEEIQKNFYNDDLHKWVDINQSVKCCMEKFLAETLMKNDYSRVQYALPDIVFRRRLELNDKGKTGKEELTPISLDLPFASYYQSSDWVEDDRGATQQAGQSVLGLYDNRLSMRVRSLACKSTFKAQVFFSRRDEVRIAQQILFWEKSPKTPIRTYCTFYWGNKPFAIPAFMMIENINTTPEWKEIDYLEKQRIFPIEIEFSVRSYMVVIPDIQRIVPLPFRFQDRGFDPSPDEIYITEETVLQFACEKLKSIDFDYSKVNKNNEELDKYSEKIFASKEYTDEVVKEMDLPIMNNISYDIIRGLHTDDVNIDFYISLNEELTTTTSAWVNLKIKKSDYNNFDHLNFIVPGNREPIVIEDFKADRIIVEGLYPNSKYPCYAVAYGLDGSVVTQTLEIITKQDPENQAPEPQKVNKKFPGLIGMEI